MQPASISKEDKLGFLKLSSSIIRFLKENKR